MPTEQDRLQRLKQITSLLADKALVPVTRAKEKAHLIAQQVDHLSERRKTLMQASTDLSLAGTFLSQAERLRIQQAAALQELAAARVVLEQEKAKAARAVAKDLVLGAVIEKRTAADLLERTRRKTR